MQEIIEGLFISNYEEAQKEALLKGNGITDVINVSSYEDTYYDSIEYHEFLHIDDTFTEDLTAVFKDTIEIIDQSLQEGKCLVHCFAGISRSPTIIVAYLVEKKGYDLDAALKLVKGKRSISKPNPNFMNQLIFRYNN